MIISLLPAERAVIPHLLEMMQEFTAIDGYPFDRGLREELLHVFLADPALGRIWMIRTQDHVAGYLVLTFGFSFEYKGRDAFIDELYLREGYRNQGIGSEALQLVRQEATRLGVHAIHLEVEKHNTRGHQVYLRQGYTGNNRALLTLKIDA